MHCSEWKPFVSIPKQWSSSERLKTQNQHWELTWSWAASPSFSLDIVNIFFFSSSSSARWWAACSWSCWLDDTVALFIWKSQIKVYKKCVTYHVQMTDIYQDFQMYPSLHSFPFFFLILINSFEKRTGFIFKLTITVCFSVQCIFWIMKLPSSKKCLKLLIVIKFLRFFKKLKEKVLKNLFFQCCFLNQHFPT